MIQNRHRKTALYATAAIGLLLALIVLLFAVEKRRTQAEMGAVLSALFSEELHDDVDKWGAGHTIQIVVQRKPDCQMCPGGGSGFDTHSWFAQSLRSRESSVFDQRSWFAQSSRITRLSFLLNSVFSTDIKTELHLPSGMQSFFVSPSDLGTKPSDSQARFPNNLGYFVVSHIGLNLNKTEALLYVDHFCGGLCGGGTYVLMRKVNGVWHVADQHSTWVS
jgi:hypothetical protein